MSQSRRNKRKKKAQKPAKNKITKKDKIKGIIALVLLVIAAFLLYFFMLKGNIQKHWANQGFQIKKVYKIKHILISGDTIKGLYYEKPKK